LENPGSVQPDPLEVEEVLWLNRSEALAHPDSIETNQGFIDALLGAIGGFERGI
jgi:NADH pyrophosphatase NudC (nudix superfamily)